jgi:hypothetical protein
MRSITALPIPLLAILSSTVALPTNDDGLKIETLTPATCSRPTRNGDRVKVNYSGTLASNGKEFDSSYSRNEPFTFTLGVHQVIEGWDKGLQEMCPGEKRELTIPPELAYGDRGAGSDIPGGATLVFEVSLVEIVGVKQEEPKPTKTEETLTIATAPSEPAQEDDKADDVPSLWGLPLTSPSHEEEQAEPKTTTTTQEGECHLLGPFALIVQGALGAVALLSLVYKRWREENKRPWKIWFFDVSKQVLGSMLTHVLNLAMSMLGSVDMVNAAKHAASKANASEGAESGGRTSPNPCSFYLLNLAIDVSCPANIVNYNGVLTCCI